MPNKVRTSMTRVHAVCQAAAQQQQQSVITTSKQISVSSRTVRSINKFYLPLLHVALRRELQVRARPADTRHDT